MRYFTPIIIVSVALAAPDAMASDSRHFKDDVAVDTQVEFHIDVPVGSVDIRHHDENVIRYSVEVEAKNDGWFSDSDLSNLKVDVEARSNSIRLELNDEDNEQHWRIWLPRNVDITADLGVGALDIEQLSQNLTAEVGVGEINVSLDPARFGSITVESGVGEASIRDLQGVRSERAMVSEESEWRGSGEYRVKLDVGVGEASVERY